MKTIATLPTLFCLCANLLFAQNNRTITIEKTTVGPDGKVHKEVIVKTGEEARAFDLEDYLESHQAENVVISIEKENGKRHNIYNVPPPVDDLYFDKEARESMREAEAEAREAYEEALAADPYNGRGFLGVSPAGDDDESKPGVRVNIVPNSGAERAGLTNGDVILQLDDTPISAWRDIEQFMINTMAGRQVTIKYRASQANESTYTISATLTSKNNDNLPDWRDVVEENIGGWNEVQIDERSKAACLGVYSEAGAGGSRVTDFTNASAAREAGMLVGDVIRAVNGQAVQNHDALWNEIAKYQPGQKVNIEFQREDQTLHADVVLSPCDAQQKIILRAQDDGGQEELSRMYIWDWTQEKQDRLRNSQVIAIQRPGEGDAPVNTNLNEPVASDRLLNVRNFSMNTRNQGGPMVLAFDAAPVPTFVTLYDAEGRQVFREELNSFSGSYQQSFDMNAFVNSTVTVHIQQGDKVFMEKVVVGL